MEKETTSNRRSSSILKPQKLKNRLSDVEKTESPNLTIEKPVRRVSFANSNFVKPFTTDPDVNTVWDDTYEEAVDHTDSTPICQQSTTSSTELLATQENQTIYPGNSLEITGVQHLITTTIDKENINPLLYPCTKDNNESILDFIKKQKLIEMAQCSVKNKTLIESCDMSVCESLINDCSDMDVTCNFSVKNEVELNPTVTDELEFTCQAPVKDLVSDTCPAGSRTLNNDISMELTTQIPNIIIENVSETTNTVDVDMEFTCQIPAKAASNLVDIQQTVLGIKELEIKEANNETLIDNCPNVVYSEKVYSPNSPFVLSNKKETSSSFHMNLTNISSCVDDTQQLIYCTFTKMNDCSAVGLNTDDLPDAEQTGHVSLPNSNNITDFKNLELLAENEASQIIAQQTNQNRLLTANDTYRLRDTKLVTDSYLHISQESIIDLVDDDVVVDDCNKGLTKKPVTDEEDYDFPLTRNCLQNLKFIKYAVTLKRYNLLESLETSKQQRQQIYTMIKNFQPRPIVVPNLYAETEEEILSEMNSLNEENSDGGSKEDDSGKSDSGSQEDNSEKHLTPTNLDAVLDKTNDGFNEKIKELEGRCEDNWKLEKVEDDKYYFLTCEKNLHVIVNFNDHGIVLGFTIQENLKSDAEPLDLFIVKQFKEKLSASSLELALGLHYDILSLLDYIQLTMQKLLEFREKFFKLGICGLTMNSDFSVTFKILNIVLTIWWEITVNLMDLENITEHDIRVVCKIGKCKEDEIKGFATNCPKGLGFISSYIDAINEYVQVGEKRKRIMMKKL